jgi:hypothetical protein
VIGKLVKSAIVKSINDCKAWALIADTTPDVSHHEQLSICVRIVDKYGYCFEHLLCCTRASGTTARSLFDTIMKALKAEGVTFGKIVTQTYDGASNMSGYCNGLQAIVQKEIGNHVVYTHCYAHTLNLVLSDSVRKTCDNVRKTCDHVRKTRILLN